MNPALSRGANSAMRDATCLASYLKRVAEGTLSVRNALGEYEAEMSKYSFEAVKESAAMGARLMGQDPLPK
jgi:2-polyprenyl-6-methoxyphenol hydroxylase-like FAD-dependent oxidoreductase